MAPKELTMSKIVKIGRYARNYSEAALKEPATIAARPGDYVTFYCSTRKGRGVHLTQVPFGTAEEIREAYHLLATAGATCNDASESERQTASVSVSTSVARR